MDCRREIFYFPVTRQYLGACGEGELVWKSQRPTLPVDLRADDFLLACAQQGWQKAVRGGALARGELARYDTKSAEFVPFLSGISADSVSFSKDGQWVAYVSFPEGTLW